MFPLLKSDDVDAHCLRASYRFLLRHGGALGAKRASSPGDALGGVDYFDHQLRFFVDRSPVA
jgi:hypothetical protein